MKKILSKYIVNTNESSNFTTCLFASACAGAVAAFITTPLDLAKLKLQISEEKVNNSFLDVLRLTYNKNGISGLFRGAGARILYMSPTSALSMAIFEQVKARI